MIAKIRFFLLLNSSNELNYLREHVSEMELKMLIKECGLFDNDDAEKNDNDHDDDHNDKNYSVLDILPLHEVYVLIINNMINLNNHVFTGESKSKYNSISDDDEMSEALDEELDFEIIDKILTPANMEMNK
ncbi:hypothetical protein C1645_812779 [Glomus cerebriforme]|uniref:Uncharacterized protein n=1 Tax=Glomus cerebriforme TaxID=658196 RepID=A0A397TTE8_9GLOM|nr:hypothetical protein C1645_812779 [Glomus cerebriforme]